MIHGSRRTLRSAAVMLMAFVPIVGAEASELQPYQMVRSLQLVQDRLADGDHAALPMQRKLLEMIDGRLQRAEPAEFDDQRNFRALLIYAMSGGNPATIRAITARITMPEDMAGLGTAVSDYVNGRVNQAAKAFDPVDPLAHPAELGGFLALIRGTVKAAEEPEQAKRNLDQARILAPGTLIEEAALRRLIALNAQLGDTRAFQRSAIQYVTRFLRSPYATQFAEAYVEGILKLHASIDTATIEETTSMMNDEQAKVIFLRIARRAAIEGKTEMLAFASRMAARWAEPGEGDGDPRAQLYANIGSITTENVAEVLARLKTIDRSRLSQDDNAFLGAAEAIAASVLVPPPELQGRTPTLRPVKAVEPPPVVAQPAAEPAFDAPVAGLISNGRAKLDAIDKLLQETAQ